MERFSAQLKFPLTPDQADGFVAQAPFLVRTNWSQFHFQASHQGFNSYENVLNSSNAYLPFAEYNVIGEVRDKRIRIYEPTLRFRRDETTVTIPGKRVAVIIIAPPSSVLVVGIAPRSKIPKMIPQTGSRLANKLAV